MTNQKSDDDRAIVKPQVIDLVAEEVVSDADVPKPGAESDQPLESESVPPFENRSAETPVPPPPPPPPPPHKAVRKASARGMALWIIAALILGGIAGAWLYREQLSSYLPTNEMEALRIRLDAMENGGQALRDQVAAAAQKADAAGEAAGQAKASADDASKTATDAAGALASRLDGLDQRIVTVEDAVKKASADLDAFRKSLSASGSATGPGSGDPAALAALAQRIDALEKDVASLKSSPGNGEKTSVTAALSQALADLKAKIAAGASYAEEYDRIARMVPAATGLDVLASYAKDGLPGPQGLAKELRGLIPSLPQPEAAAPADDGYWSSLLGSLSGVVSIRTIGESNWPAVAENAATFADTGDLTQAVAAIDAAEGEKPVVLSQWRERAASRLRLEESLSQASEAVMRQIAALGAAP